MGRALDWIKNNPVVSVIIALGSLIAGGVTALLLWGPNPSAEELRTAEEQMVTNAEPALPPEVAVIVLGLTGLVWLYVNGRRRWTADGE